MIAQRRDENEPEIVAALRAVGCAWIPMDKMAGFDGILISPRNGIHIVEIKNPLKKWKLTEAEQERKADVERAGGVYSVILRADDALLLAGYSVI